MQLPLDVCGNPIWDSIEFDWGPSPPTPPPLDSDLDAFDVVMPIKDLTTVSSLNLEEYEAWKENPLFIKDVMRFLDNVLEDFINKAPDSMAKARIARIPNPARLTYPSSRTTTGIKSNMASLSAVIIKAPIPS